MLMTAADITELLRNPDAVARLADEPWPNVPDDPCAMLRGAGSALERLAGLAADNPARLAPIAEDVLEAHTLLTNLTDELRTVPQAPSDHDLGASPGAASKALYRARDLVAFLVDVDPALLNNVAALVRELYLLIVPAAALVDDDVAGQPGGR